MNHLELREAVRSLPPLQQVAYLKQLGYTDEQIPDFLNWILSNGVQTRQSEKEKQDNRMAETLEKLKARMEFAKQNPEPPKLDGMDPFERDQLHNQYMLGGSTLYDGASYHNPELRQTETFSWMRNVFHGSAKSFALLLGGTGAGKTFAAIAYTNMIAKVDIVMGKIQYSNAAYLHAYKLAEMLANIKKHGEELDKYKQKGVLVLDDLGTEPVGFRGADFQAHLGYLIDERHKFRRKTIITSNTTMESKEKTIGFKELYGDRIVSRLMESGFGLETNDPDLRRGGSPQ